MTKIITLLLFASMGLSSLSANPEFLNAELKIRTQVSNKLTEEFIEDAKLSDLKDKLVPLEEKSGKNWAEYLTYVLESKDQTLKKLVLRNEFTQEIIDAHYELEYEDRVATKLLLNMKITNFKNKLEQLSKLGTKLELQPEKKE